jgi:DNA topoisomerase-1
MKPAVSPATAKLIRQTGLHRVGPEDLTIRRLRRGRGFVYLRPGNRPVRDPATLRRLASLAVPPAYQDVLFAADPSAHLQAIGRDAAGRLQYRYHPDWEKVRELRKARRLMRMVKVMPKVRRAVARYLAEKEPTRLLALAAVVDLVACSAGAMKRWP